MSSHTPSTSDSQSKQLWPWEHKNAHDFTTEVSAQLSDSHTEHRSDGLAAMRSWCPIPPFKPCQFIYLEPLDLYFNEPDSCCNVLLVPHPSLHPVSLFTLNPSICTSMSLTLAAIRSWCPIPPCIPSTHRLSPLATVWNF